MLRTCAAVALATSVVAFAAPAEAQENTARPMGLRFELGWAGHSNLATFGSPDLEGAPAQPSFGTVSPNGDIKVGYDFGQFTPLIGLSFANNSISNEDDDSFTATILVIDVEGRYYFKPHRKGLNPFVFGEFNTSLVSLGVDPEPEGEAADLLDDAESALDYTTINAGFGLEYKFDQAAFAIGGKWGLGLAFQGFDSGDESISNTTIGTLGAIYAAWRI